MQIKSTTSLTLPQTEGTSSKCLQTIPARIADVLAEYINGQKYKLVMKVIKKQKKGSFKSTNRSTLGLGNLTLRCVYG